MDDIEMARVEKTPKEIDEEIKRKKEIQLIGLIHVDVKVN